MERFAQSQRQQRSFEGSESARRSCWEVDFSDVFGGPPRRYSMQEVKMRYSLSETALEDLDYDNTAAATTTTTTTWSGLNEKPVFGGEIVNRRRYANDGFFDDIFKADEAHGSPSRRPEREPFGSSPGSRVLSPARPSPPPKAEPFGSSLPAQFSLSAKLTTAMDYPATSPEKSKEGTSNGISNSQISKASFAKFLNRVINGKNEAKGDRQSYRQSPLSREVSLTSEESPRLVLPEGKGKGSPLKEGTGNDGSFLHIQMAGGGVPLMMPLRAGKSPIERSSGSNGWIECDNLDNETSGTPASADNGSVSSNGELKSLKVGVEKTNKQNNEKGTESHRANNDVDVEVLESDISNGPDKPPVVSKAKLNGRNVLHSLVQEEKHEKTKKEVRTKESRASRPGSRPLSELLTQKLDALGKKEENGSGINSSRAAKSVPISDKEKKNDARTKISHKVPLLKDGSPGSPSRIPAKTGVKGKVREFVRIFHHEPIGKTKINPDTHSQSSRWKNTDKHGSDSERSSAQDVNEKMQSRREDMKSNHIPKVDENNFMDKVKQPSSHGSNRNTDKRDASSSRESFGLTYMVSSGNTEDLFQESFVVKELSHHEDKGVETRGDSEDNWASDAKIQQWAHGRKGNIRSLLSTLQYVLWEESGWKPIALVDIIEASAVKRSYQRALLCLHPDKLQQKDASSRQKYIAEKVFAILQEAWDHFNSD